MKKEITPRGLIFTDPKDPVVRICKYFPETDTIIWYVDKKGIPIISVNKQESTAKAVRQMYDVLMKSPVGIKDVLALTDDTDSLPDIEEPMEPNNT
jgi:hypothetical protein